MSEPFSLPGLISGGWRRAVYQPFRDGVEISPILTGEPGVALLRYAPGAGVPRHFHHGLETIVVLDGTQSDDNGDYPAGSVVLNPEGTSHRVWSTGGCVVLIQWNRAVEFVADA
ncbi:MAG: cupin domain-containing protein [Gemmobacter sp.]